MSTFHRTHSRVASRMPSRALIGVTVATLAVLLATSSALGFGTFVYSKFYLTGDKPYRLATADLDKDGHPDIVVSNCGSAYASVFWNKGDGTFLAPKQLVLGSNTCPYGVAFGDFNKDGKTDVVVSEFNANDVAVFLNEGHRTFKAAAEYDTSPALGPVDLVVSDFNRDGFLDIAVDGYGSSTVAVLKGHAGGFEKAAGQRTVGSKPIAMISGDFNKDGKVDLVTANNGGSTLSLLNGHGNGTFSTPVSLPVGKGPAALAKGDFNRDGELDIAALNTSGQPQTISLLRGAGHGRFHAQRIFGLGVVYPSGLAAGDFDGDHWPDLAVGEYSGAAVLFNNGSGSFVLPPAMFPVYRDFPSDVVAAKLNGDGALDLVFSSLGDDPGGIVDTGGISVLLNHR
jgi:FG-GAP-like repeat